MTTVGHWLLSSAVAFGAEESRAYLVKSVNLLLAFDVVFVVGKDLESVQTMSRLPCTTPTACRQPVLLCCELCCSLLQFVDFLWQPQAGHAGCVFTCHDASAC